MNSSEVQPVKGLAITYLVRLSVGSPSGGRSEIENLNVIKKIREGYLDFPYISSQAMKRAFRDTLKGLGYPVSPVLNTKPARTAGKPEKYIDDDLFGYMDPSSKKEIKPDNESLSGEDNMASVDESADFVLLKEQLELIKTKKAKLTKYFDDQPQKEQISSAELQNELQLSEKDIEKLKKEVSNSGDSLKKLIQNINGTRKSVVSMTPAISMIPYDDGVDFGANMMALKHGGSPMPYETEVHRGWYRLTLYIDLERIGSGEGFVTDLQKIIEKKANVSEILSQTSDFDFIIEESKKFSGIKKVYATLRSEERYKRAKALLDAIRFLAPSGRSSNWLIDLTPKLMVAAYVNGARTPFLETQLLDENNMINLAGIESVKNNFSDGIVSIEGSNCLVVGYRDDLIHSPSPDPSKPTLQIQSMKEAFSTIDGWLKRHYNVEGSPKGSAS